MDKAGGSLDLRAVHTETNGSSYTTVKIGEKEVNVLGTLYDLANNPIKFTYEHLRETFTIEVGIAQYTLGFFCRING